MQVEVWKTEQSLSNIHSIFAWKNGVEVQSTPNHMIRWSRSSVLPLQHSVIVTYDLNIRIYITLYCFNSLIRVRLSKGNLRNPIKPPLRMHCCKCASSVFWAANCSRSYCSELFKKAFWFPSLDKVSDSIKAVSWAPFLVEQNTSDGFPRECCINTSVLVKRHN